MYSMILYIIMVDYVDNPHDMVLVHCSLAKQSPITITIHGCSWPSQRNGHQTYTIYDSQYAV
jgi:hypothetical protein